MMALPESGASLEALRAFMEERRVDPVSLILDRTKDGRRCARMNSVRGELVVAVERGGVWQRFELEHDQALRGSVLVADREALTELCGGHRVDAVERIAHRPGRRAVLRVRTPSKTYYVKLLRRSAFERIAAVSKLCAEVGLSDLCVLPRLLDGDRRGLVFEGVEAPSLHEIGRRRDPFWDRGATSALHRLHSTRVESPGLPRRDALTERSDALKMLDRGREFVPELEAVHHVVASLDVHPCGCSEGLLHGDLHDKQILVSPAGARLIDLDTLGLGPRCVDLRNLRAHCELRAAQGVWDAGWARERMHALDARTTNCTNSRLLDLCTRARLMGVYAHRPTHWPLVRRWAEEFLQGERRTA